MHNVGDPITVRHNSEVDQPGRDEPLEEPTVELEEDGKANLQMEANASLAEETEEGMNWSEEKEQELAGEANWGLEEHEEDTESQQEMQDEVNKSLWKVQADLEEEMMMSQGLQQAGQETEKGLMDPINLLTGLCVEEEEGELIEKQCEHNSYDLVSYEMVEKAGWSWMMEDTIEKECNQCQQRKKLSGRNPMFYCRRCHGHGICKGCWSSQLLCESRSGRGRLQRNGSKGRRDHLRGTGCSPRTDAACFWCHFEFEGRGVLASLSLVGRERS